MRQSTGGPASGWSSSGHEARAGEPTGPARVSLSFWDAVILGAAQSMGCGFLLSEGLPAGEEDDRAAKRRGQ